MMSYFEGGDFFWLVFSGYFCGGGVFGGGWFGVSGSFLWRFRFVVGGMVGMFERV